MSPRFILLPLVVFFAICIAVIARQPPTGDAGTGFSLANAKAVVADISRTPHTAATPENAVVRDNLKTRLEALGLSVRVQSGMGVRQVHRNERAINVAPYDNIIAVLPGRNRNIPAVALMAHYDSAPFAPGAADDAAGVAALLETARNLSSGPKPFRDVVFLLTDAEEPGMIGAQAFFDKDPLAEKIGAVVNAEARGSDGRAFMFQTSRGNRELVALWAKHAISPTGNSMADAVYQKLPNDTDLTVPLLKKKVAINAAFVDGLHDYHMPTDSPAHLNDGALQHLGNFALTTTRALAMAPQLPNDGSIKGQDSAYFDFFALMVFQYPISWGWGLSLLAFAAIAFSGFQKLGTDWKKVTSGTLGMALLFAVAAGLCHGLAYLVYDSGMIAMRERINEMMLALWLFIGLCSGLALMVRPKISMWVGACLLLAIVSLVAQIKMPGANWLFGWGAILGAILVCIAARFGMESRLTLGVSAIFGGLLGALLLEGVITTYVSVGPITPAPIALILPFAIVLIGPIIIAFGEHPWSRLTAALVFSLSLVGMLALYIVPSWSSRTPKPGDLFHLTDQDSGKSYWATTSSKDQLPAGPKSKLSVKGFYRSPFLRVPGAAAGTLPPNISMSEADGKITMRFSGHGAPNRAMMFLVKPARELKNVTVNEHSVTLNQDTPTRIAYRPETPGELVLRFDKDLSGSLSVQYLFAVPGMPSGGPVPDGPTTDWTPLSGSRVIMGSQKLNW